MRTRTTTLLLSLLLAGPHLGCGHGRALREAHEAQAAIAEGRLDEGRAALVRALELDPELRGVHTALALAALTAGDPVLAEQELLRELERHPEDEAARVDLALLLLKGDRAQEALRHLGSPADGDDPRHRATRALALLHLDRLVEARVVADEARQAIGDVPAPEGEAPVAGRGFASHVAGLVAARQGRTSDAIAALQEASRLEPEVSAPHVALGVVRLQAQQAKEGAEEARAAVEAFPEDAELRLVAGLLLLEAGDAAGARTHLSRAVALAPDRPGARLALAAAASRAGDDTEAARLLEEELRRDPDLALAHKNRAILLFRKGDLAGARASFQRAAELAPDDEQARVAADALARHTP